jgi:hypothetical protein
MVQHYVSRKNFLTSRITNLRCPFRDWNADLTAHAAKAKLALAIKQELLATNVGMI